MRKQRCNLDRVLMIILGGALGLAEYCVAAQPLVMVSIPPQAWLVKQLAGDTVMVTTLLNAGGDLHLYEPTARQVRQLAGATCYLTLGLPFETRLTAQVRESGTGPRVVAMDAGIEKIGAHQHDHPQTPPEEEPIVCTHDHGGDPHIWLSPRLMCVMASNTATVLSQCLPQPLPASALERVIKEIQATDAAVRARLQALTPRTWVVYHPSWNYFAAAYNLTPLVLEQDGKAPSARHLVEMIRQAREVGVTTVFAAKQCQPRPARLLAQQIHARLVMLDPLQEDWPALLREAADSLAGSAPTP